MNQTPSLAEVAKTICSIRGYALADRVGMGAFKETFSAVTMKNELVALKVLRGISSPQRLNREIAAMKQCDHRNIAKLLFVDVVEIAGTKHLYMVEEYLDGGTLADRISNRLTQRDELIDLAGQLVSAVGHMASLGLVHRDLKPDNVMFREDGRTPVVVDFGIVRNLAEPTLTHAWQQMGPGTPYFAAPEQLLNQKELIDWRTDQFALGVVLFLCGFGIHPYCRPGDSKEEVVQRVSQRQGPSGAAVEACSELGLHNLTQMVASWTVERFRTPELLLKAWNG